MKTKIISFCLSLLLITSPAKAQDWEFVGLDSLAIYHLSVSGDTIYAGTIDRNNSPNIDDGLYFTSNGGYDWIQLDSTLGNGYINGLHLISPENLFILKTGTVYKTTNSGQSWSPINNFSSNPIRWFGISPFNRNELYAIDEIGVPGGVLNNLYKSTNNGSTWILLGPFPGSSHGSELRFSFDSTDSLNLYVSVDDRFNNLYLFKSTDKGNNWFYVSSPPFLPNDIYTDKIIPNRIYMFPGPYVSNEGGSSWFLADSGLTDTSYYISFFQDKLTTNLTYILKSDGLYSSTIDTFYWQKMLGSESLSLDFPPTTKNMNNIKIDEELNKIYLGTSEGLFRTDVLTNISYEKEPYANKYLLQQNFPNPFNPETKIKYYIPITTHVMLKAYDLLGNELRLLVDEEKSEGEYEVQFNGINYSSGVYIYSLIAGSQRISKKMMLIK
jgi:hypothetical protein